MARPILHEGGRHTARFKVGDTESAEAVEALFLDSEFFENRIQRATKEVRLKKWCPRASPKEKALFPVANEIPEHCRNGRVQVHLTESVNRLWSLDSTFPYGLCNRDCVAVEVLHFQTEQFACAKAAGREENVDDTLLLLSFGDDFGDFLSGEHRSVLVFDNGNVGELVVPFCRIELVTILINGRRLYPSHHLRHIPDGCRTQANVGQFLAQHLQRPVVDVG